MKNLRLAILSAVVVSTILGSAFFLGLVRPASSSPAPAVTFEYRAKWICNAPAPNFVGLTSFGVNTTSAENIGLVPGEYKTDINIHNPSHSANVTMLKTFVLSVPEIGAARVLTVSLATILLPGHAFFIDCRDIFLVYKNFGIGLCGNDNASFTCAVKGFLILDQLTSLSPLTFTGFSSANTLDVVAEYSSQSFAPTSTFAPADNQCIIQFAFTPCVSSGTSLEVTPIPASPFVS